MNRYAKQTTVKRNLTQMRDELDADNNGCSKDANAKMVEATLDELMSYVKPRSLDARTKQGKDYVALVELATELSLAVRYYREDHIEGKK